MRHLPTLLAALLVVVATACSPSTAVTCPAAGAALQVGDETLRDDGCTRCTCEPTGRLACTTADCPGPDTSTPADGGGPAVDAGIADGGFVDAGAPDGGFDAGEIAVVPCRVTSLFGDLVAPLTPAMQFFVDATSFEPATPGIGVARTTWRLLRAPPGSRSAPAAVEGARNLFVTDGAWGVDLFGTYVVEATVHDALGGARAHRCAVEVKPPGMFVSVSWDATADLDLHLAKQRDDGRFCMNATTTRDFGRGEVCPDGDGTDDCDRTSCRSPDPPGVYVDFAPDGGVEPYLLVDDADGFGPEGTRWFAPAPGTYLVSVQHYGGPPTNATVRVWLDGALRTEVARLVGPGAWWEAVVLTVDDAQGCAAGALTDGGFLADASAVDDAGAQEDAGVEGGAPVVDDGPAPDPPRGASTCLARCPSMDCGPSCVADACGPGVACDVGAGVCGVAAPVCADDDACADDEVCVPASDRCAVPGCDAACADPRFVCDDDARRCVLAPTPCVDELGDDVASAGAIAAGVTEGLLCPLDVDVLALPVAQHGRYDLHFTTDRDEPIYVEVFTANDGVAGWSTVARSPSLHAYYAPADGTLFIRLFALTEVDVWSWAVWVREDTTVPVPPTCDAELDAGTEPDDDLAHARPLAYDAPFSSSLCGPDDRDVYVLDVAADAGAVLSARTHALEPSVWVEFEIADAGPAFALLTQDGGATTAPIAGPRRVYATLYESGAFGPPGVVYEVEATKVALPDGGTDWWTE